MTQALVFSLGLSLARPGGGQSILERYQAMLARQANPGVQPTLRQWLAFKAFCYLAPRFVLVHRFRVRWGWTGLGGVIWKTYTHLTNNVAQDMADAFTAALDAGTAGIITIYTGTVPTDADTAIGAQTLLATLTFNATSFTAATDATPGGRITANAITSDTSADATGTAAWARLLTQAAGTTICDVDVGTSATTIIFNTVSFTSGSTIAITSFTFTMPES